MWVTISVLFVLMSVMAHADGKVAVKSFRDWRFVATLSGEYINLRRLREGVKHDLIHATARPVDVPCLRPKPVLLFEVDDGKRVEFRHILVVTDDGGDFLKVTPMNITGSYAAGPGQFDTSILSNLTCDELKSDPNCLIEYNDLAENVFVGSWPVCTRTINGTHPSWTPTFTCDKVIVTIPMSSGETRDLQPYEVELIGPKFPLINPPPGFINPCDKKQQ